MQGTQAKMFMEIKLKSDIAEVRMVLERVRMFLKGHSLEHILNVQTVLRELLDNAIRHGNAFDEAKTVTCKVEISQRNSVTLVVEDEGNGFNPHQLNLHLPEDPRQIKRRGLKLIQAISECVHFNDSGNCVRAHICSS